MEWGRDKEGEWEKSRERGRGGEGERQEGGGERRGVERVLPFPAALETLEVPIPPHKWQEVSYHARERGGWECGGTCLYINNKSSSSCAHYGMQQSTLEGGRDLACGPPCNAGINKAMHESEWAGILPYLQTSSGLGG